MLTVRDISKMLQVKPAHVRRLISGGQLEAFNVNVNHNSSRPEIRVRPEALQEFLDARVMVKLGQGVNRQVGSCRYRIKPKRNWLNGVCQ